MPRARVIPVLLIKNAGLVKTIRFKNEKYVGDPINAVKILNEKEVDEIIILDITASVEKRRPNIKMISDIASECFMPVCYGGGITHIDEIKEIFYTGVEKVSINTNAVYNPGLILEAARLFGSQSIVVSIDVKKNLFGEYRVFTHRGKNNTHLGVVESAVNAQNSGAGEIFLTSIDRDGTYKGYDTELIKKVSEAVSIPVIACAGAGNIADFTDAIRCGASAVAAGSLFVFYGKNRAVLINFPSQEELKNYSYMA
jgi:cyclase